MATTTLGSKAIGSTVKLKEGGTLVEFYVAQHNYESSLNGTGRTMTSVSGTIPTSTPMPPVTWTNGLTAPIRRCWTR